MSNKLKGVIMIIVGFLTIIIGLILMIYFVPEEEINAIIKFIGKFKEAGTMIISVIIISCGFLVLFSGINNL